MGVLGVYATLFCLGGLLSYSFHSFGLSIKGWDNIAQFKSHFAPFGLFNNIWASLCIGLLSIPLLNWNIWKSQKWIKITATLSFGLINLGVIISYSRGAYISLFFFYFLTSLLLLGLRLIKFKNFLLILIACMPLLLLFTISNSKSVLTTVSMNSTVSQKRSTQGRLTILERSFCQFEENKWLGVGGYNYPLINDKCKPSDDQGSYSAFTNNTYLQILIEKGILGLGIYASFLLGILMVMINSIRREKSAQRKITLVLILAAWLSIGLRELFFSGLFYNSGLLLLFAIFSGLGFLSYTKPNQKSSNWWKGIIGVFFLSLLFIFYQKSVYAKSLKTSSTANKHILAPINNQQAILTLTSNLELETILKDSIFPKKEELQQAAKLLDRSISLNPFDASYHFNRAWISHWMSEDSTIALSHLDKCLKLDPGIELYQIGAGLLKDLRKDSLGALLHYQKAFELSPQLLDAPIYPLLLKRYPQDIEKLLEKCIDNLTIKSSQQDPIASAKLAKILFHKGDTAQSKNLWEKVSTQIPNLNRPYFHLAKILIDQKNYDEAYDLLSKATYLDYYDHLSHLAYADLFNQRSNQSQGDLYFAVDSYQNALENYLRITSPSSKKSKAKYLYAAELQNDLLPQSLLMNCRPKLDVVRVCENIGSLYKQIGNEKLSSHYHSLARRDPRLIKISDILR